MIPMGMGDKNIRVNGTPLKIVDHKPVPQGFYPRTEIYDYQPFIGSDFKAGGISPKNNRIPARTGYGSPVSPEMYR
jgi:hypothetical protein